MLPPIWTHGRKASELTSTLRIACLLVSGCAPTVGATATDRSGVATEHPFHSTTVWPQVDGGCARPAVRFGANCVVCDFGKWADCYEHCINGEGDACALDGFERGSAGDARTAADLYERACELGSGSGCEYLARALMRGEGRPIDEKVGMNLLQRMCEANRGFACTNFAIGLFEGRGRARDPELAEKILNRACGLEDELACQLLREPQRSRDVDSAVRAARVHYMSCKLGDTSACAAGPSEPNVSP